MNGNLVDEDGPNVSLRDTGLLHAAGVFTTTRASGGKVFRLERHLERLRKSCEALFVPLQFSDADLAGAVDEVLRQNGLADARMRMTVTRGQATQDPLHGTHLTPNCFVTATDLQPYPEQYYEQGLTVMLNDEQKLNPYDLQAGHKTLNYFSRLAALREAVRRVLSDPARRSRMSENCRRIAVAEYSLEGQAKGYETLYRSLIGSRRSVSTHGGTAGNDGV